MSGGFDWQEKIINSSTCDISHGLFYRGGVKRSVKSQRFVITECRGGGELGHSRWLSRLRMRQSVIRVEANRTHQTLQHDRIRPGPRSDVTWFRQRAGPAANLCRRVENISFAFELKVIN